MLYPSELRAHALSIVNAILLECAALFPVEAKQRHVDVAVNQRDIGTTTYRTGYPSFAAAPVCVDPRAPHDTGSNVLSKMHGEKAIGSFAFRCGECNTSDEYCDFGALFGGEGSFCTYNYCERCPPTGQRCPTHRADYRKPPKRNAESPGERHSRYFKTAVDTKFSIVAC